MRHVGEQVFLRAHETLDALGHLVERARELGDLVGPPRAGAVGRRARREIAAAQPPRGGREPLDRPRDALREGPRGDRHAEQREDDHEDRTPERRWAQVARHAALYEADHGSRRRIADRRRREAQRPPADDEATGADVAQLRGRERRQILARGGDDAAVHIAHAHGHVQIVVDLVQARRERRRIADPLADERGEVARHARRHLAPEGLARAQREDDAGGHRDDEQHAEKVEIDPGVQACHVSRDPARGRSRRRGRS